MDFETYPPDEFTHHAAVSSENCLGMEEKYGWELERIEVLDEPVGPFEVDCIFKGDAQFPNYLEDDD